MNRTRIAATWAALAIASLSFAQARIANENAITGARLKAHLELVANDLLEGRNTPSPGLDLACTYVATQLKLWGAKPAGDDGGFFQKIDLGPKGMAGKFTQNVVAIIEGSDPVLKNEYVAIGAHIDHVGKGQGEGDTIYNGADDDGSGTVSVLEIAHAFLTGARPKRSILLVWHCGEERGLWGSDYFTEHPTVALDKVVAQLNIDMIGRSRPAGDTKPENNMLTAADEIYVVGSRKLSTEFGDIMATTNKNLYKLRYNYHYDEPNDPENIYMRSDHYNYARKGIPIAFWFDGVHEDYHRPSDEVSKIDFAKMERISRTIYASAFVVANRTERPKMNAK